MSNVLTIPDQKAAFDVVRGKSTSGQGELMAELSKEPLAKSERDASKPWRRMDHIHLSRFDDTDYVQWWGRCSDGFHRPIGRIMQIVSITSPAANREVVS